MYRTVLQIGNSQYLLKFKDVVRLVYMHTLHGANYTAAHTTGLLLTSTSNIMNTMPINEIVAQHYNCMIKMLIVILIYQRVHIY